MSGIGMDRKRLKRRTAMALPPAADAAPLTVLFAASELFPLVKTGGLADVASKLPAALQQRGIDVRIVIPAYTAALEHAGAVAKLGDTLLPPSGTGVSILQATHPQSKLSVYLIDAPTYFRRPGDPYVDADGGDWPDNAERFALFARAVCALALDQAGLRWRPQILHCNDWHTGLAPALLSTEAGAPATAFTIHNLAYQGRFPYSTFTALRLPAAMWSPQGLEFYGDLSFIKGGLAYADALIAVSPGFAGDILTPAGGHGYDGLLRHRRERLRGILNGVDYREWDPRRDPYIDRHYWIDSLAGKAVNKRALQQELGLEPHEQSFLIGHIGRLSDQKGTDLIAGAVDTLMREEQVQLAVLGSGAPHFRQSLLAAAARWPRRVAVRTEFSERLAHRIEAGADCFVMPSREEPCGLNQLYSLRYGTVPIVRATGGLVDTVNHATAQALADGSATGFHFQAPTPQALATAILAARRLYRTQPGQWTAMMSAGMRREFSWGDTAAAYHALYAELLEVRAAR